MFDRHDIRAAAAQAVAEVERWIDRRHPPRPAGGRRRHKAEPDVEAASRARRPGVAAGLCRTAAGGGEVSVVEASRRPGSGALTLTGRQGEVMRESARTALSWRRANAARYGLDPNLHRDTDVHLHVQSAEVPKEGASAGVTMAAALVSAFTRRPVRTDVAMTGESTHGGQALGVGGIAENRRCPARGTSPPSARRAGRRFPRSARYLSEQRARRVRHGVGDDGAFGQFQLETGSDRIAGHVEQPGRQQPELVGRQSAVAAVRRLGQRVADTGA